MGCLRREQSYRTGPLSSEGRNIPPSSFRLGQSMQSQSSTEKEGRRGSHLLLLDLFYFHSDQPDTPLNLSPSPLDSSNPADN